MNQNIAKARKLLTEAKGDQGIAKTALLKLASTDADFRSYLIDLGASTLIRNLAHSETVRSLRVVGSQPREQTESKIRESNSGLRSAASTLLGSYRLADGTALGKASRSDLEYSASARERNGRGEFRLAKFERLIAKHIGNGSPESLGERRLAELKAVAERTIPEPKESTHAA